MWRPRRPWDWVVVSDAPSAFPEHRTTVWHHAPYRLQEAPPVDVTPYALSPIPPISGGTDTGRYWITPPPGVPPGDQIAGPVELIVSNRNPESVQATLTLRLRGLERARLGSRSAPARDVCSASGSPATATAP